MSTVLPRPSAPVQSTLRVARVEPIAVSLPMVKPVKMSFEEVRRAENLLVRVETEDGTVGWGEAASAPTMTGETVTGMAAAVSYLAPLLRGANAGDPGAAMAAVERYLYGNNAAKSAIEMALYDALGRASGKPLCELLGGQRRSRIPLLRMVGTGKMETDVEEARRSRVEGYIAYKIKVGVADPKADAARTRAVCEVLGPDVLVCADANQAWSPEEAVAYVTAVADTTLAFFEQPVAAADIAGMARVARASRIPIGVDEGLHSMDDLRRHHEAGAAQGCSLKTIKLGGVKPVADAALLCETLGMQINLACKIAESGIATAAMLHLAAVAPNVNWGVSLTSQYLAEDIVRGLPAVVRGHLEVPTGPGLGIDVDEARVRAHARTA
ncbi:MAG: mandelate racemase/muconate lactonizing enzyme family protein [Rhodospirillaceae bacterium]